MNDKIIEQDGNRYKLVEDLNLKVSRGDMYIYMYIYLSSPYKKLREISSNLIGETFKYIFSYSDGIVNHNYLGYKLLDKKIIKRIV